MLVALALHQTSDAQEEKFHDIDVMGTAFRIVKSDGGVLTSRDLVGAVLNLDNGLKLRIDAVEIDPEDSGGEVLLHTLSAQAADGSWTNICQPGPDGRRQAFPLAGRFRPDGSIVDISGSFEIVCSSGAQGKCVRFGYKPWQKAPDGTPMRPYYNACVRMVRADYCGDGTGTTRDGTLIDIYDRLDIQRSEAEPEMTFEAAWTPQGAICVARVRIPENISLEALRATCPRMHQARLGAACTEEFARGETEALLFNKSLP